MKKIKEIVNRILNHQIKLNSFHLILLCGWGIGVVSTILVFTLIIMPYKLSNSSHPLDRFELPKNIKTKVYFSNGEIKDSIATITITKNTVKINKTKIKDLEFEYWHVGNIELLSWKNKKYIIQYKSIGFYKPHSLDIFKIDSKKPMEEFVF